MGNRRSEWIRANGVKGNGLRTVLAAPRPVAGLAPATGRNGFVVALFFLRLFFACFVFCDVYAGILPGWITYCCGCWLIWNCFFYFKADVR